MELCELVTKNPHEVKGLRVEPILRSGPRTFTDEARHLRWGVRDMVGAGARQRPLPFIHSGDVAR